MGWLMKIRIHIKSGIDDAANEISFSDKDALSQITVITVVVSFISWLKALVRGLDLTVTTMCFPSQKDNDAKDDKGTEKNDDDASGLSCPVNETEPCSVNETASCQDVPKEPSVPDTAEVRSPADAVAEVQDTAVPKRKRGGTKKKSERSAKCSTAKDSSRAKKREKKSEADVFGIQWDDDTIIYDMDKISEKGWGIMAEDYPEASGTPQRSDGAETQEHEQDAAQDEPVMEAQENSPMFESVTQTIDYTNPPHSTRWKKRNLPPRKPYVPRPYS